ncbi:hypothetical protein ACLB1G_20115 [Oxalobacteraceae bacterium A2-2]
MNDSKPWAQPGPLDHATAIGMSHALEAMASKKERQLRAAAHAASRAFMDAAHAAGGVGVTSKTYMVKGDPERRVDIEVREGIAFV